MVSGAYGVSAVGSQRLPTAYLVVVGVLAGLGALLNCLASFLLIFATDDCSKDNPAFRCTRAGMLTMWGAPWVGLVAAAGVSVALGMWWRGGWMWCGLPAGVAVYAGGLLVTWRVMTS